MKSCFFATNIRIMKFEILLDVWTDTKVAVFKNFVNPKVLTLLQPKKYEKQEFLISKVGGKQLEFISQIQIRGKFDFSIGFLVEHFLKF